MIILQAFYCEDRMGLRLFICCVIARLLVNFFQKVRAYVRWGNNRVDGAYLSFFIETSFPGCIILNT